MPYTRRHVIRTGAALAAAGTLGSLPRPLLAATRSPRSDRERDQRPRSVPLFEDPQLKSLTDASLSIARTAGAAYADVRLTHTYIQRFGPAFPIEEESMTFGVRVLVGGYWGFAAGPVWSVDEAVRLARAAIGNAKANTLGKPRVMELAPITPMTSGHWTTPIKDDPFQIHRSEIDDFLQGIRNFIESHPKVLAPMPRAEFIKQDKAFASTNGQYCTQRLYDASGAIPITLELGHQSMTATLDCITRAGAGFEYFRDQPLEEEISRTIESMRSDLMLPVQPVDVGRYPLVLDARSVSSVVSQTIGAATELDRALGYEANAGGTSYIVEPEEMVGSFQIGTPLINITADRTKPGSVATVKWDDEGVTPDEFALVKDGVLVDMQTDREGAGWFKNIYARHQKPLRSHGCSFAPLAILPPMTHCANLTLRPGTDAEATFDTLIADVSNGIVFKAASIDMDFQQITGFGGGSAYQIKNGKRVASLAGAGFIFRTPEFWKAVNKLGGAASSQSFGLTAWKGQPMQISGHTVTVPPVMLKEITVIDRERKA